MHGFVSWLRMIILHYTFRQVGERALWDASIQNLLLEAVGLPEGGVLLGEKGLLLATGVQNPHAQKLQKRLQVVIGLRDVQGLGPQYLVHQRGRNSVIVPSLQDGGNQTHLQLGLQLERSPQITLGRPDKQSRGPLNHDRHLQGPKG